MGFGVGVSGIDDGEAVVMAKTQKKAREAYYITNSKLAGYTFRAM
jgi:hypothetical protein